MAVSVNLLNLLKTVLILAGMAFAATYLVYKKNPASLSSNPATNFLSKVFSLGESSSLPSHEYELVNKEEPQVMDFINPFSTRAALNVDWSILYEGNSLQRAKIAAAIREAAETYSLDSGLIRAIIMAESMFDPFAVSPKGAKGLMQLMPETAVEVGVKEIFDPRENVLGGSLYLAKLLQDFNGDIKLALAAYHSGPQRVRDEGKVVPWESQEYVRMVLIYGRYFGYVH
jgi:soluble lytic murein transglycosylase-like protein